MVADPTRSDQTICLAVSPSLKAKGVPSRPRLFEAKQAIRKYEAEHRTKLDYIIAVPRMAEYERISAQIYGIYLRYVAPDDIHVYSIDECFIDCTGYLHAYRKDAEKAGTNPARLMAITMIRDVLKTTGITATVGIGTNLYLAKVAMDIVAKKQPADKDGVRIAELNEDSYKFLLWDHKPLTDFWQIGIGKARRLEKAYLFTMGDIARCSVKNEDLLYRLFGKNAELLIDHAWGFEPCTVPEIKAYKPETNSISSGQVLHCPYETDKAKLVLKEMADQLALDLVNKKIVTDQIVLTVGYDIENLSNPSRRSAYHGSIETDRYGRSIPKQAHGTQNLDDYTSSSHRIMNAAVDLFDRLIDPTLLIRRLYIVANHIIPEDTALQKKDRFTQLDLFTDYAAEEQKQKADAADLERERKLQEAMLSIRKKFGKNAVLKAMNLEEGATAKDRNNQIGGHKA